MEGGRLLLCTSPRPSNEEWIGLFDPPTVAIPTVVFQGQTAPNFVITQDVQTLVLDDTQVCFTVMPQSKVLLPAPGVQQVDRRRAGGANTAGPPLVCGFRVWLKVLERRLSVSTMVRFVNLPGTRLS
jgi:hypothetical protein